MPEDIDPQTYEAFVTSFRELGKKIYKHNALVVKVPLRKIINSLVEASYKTLSEAVISRMILTGKMPPHLNDLSPKSIIRQREAIVAEIMTIMGAELARLDPKHEYSLGMIKREKRGKKT